MCVGDRRRLRLTPAAGQACTARTDGKLYAQPAPLSLPQLQTRIREFVDAYNTEHRHSSLDGMTPAEKWASSAAPLEVIEPERLRWMLLADLTRPVLKDGVHFESAIFIAPELTRIGGKTVEVRYMPDDLRSIDAVERRSNDSPSMSANSRSRLRESATSPRVVERSS